MKRVLGCALFLPFLLAACSESPSATTEEGLYFPTAGDRNGAFMSALFQGEPVVRDDCVLAGPAGDYMLPVWPEGYTADRDDSGRLVVRDTDGRTVAIEGDTFEAGGGYIVEFRPEEKVASRDEQLRQANEVFGLTIPERCLGRDVYGVWLAGPA